MSQNTRLWIVLFIIAVFLAGLGGGILLDRTLLQKESKRSTRPRSTVRFPTLEIMAEELGLSQKQQDGIRQIFRDSEEELEAHHQQIQGKFKEMRHNLQQKIKDLLNDEQIKKYDAMIQSYREARKKEYENRHKKPKSESPENKGEKS
jgi:hypothetical protein